MVSIHLLSRDVPRLLRLCHSRRLVPCVVGPTGEGWLGVFSCRLEGATWEADSTTRWLSRKLRAVAVQFCTFEDNLRLYLCEAGRPLTRFPEDWRKGRAQGQEAVLKLCSTDESRQTVRAILEAQWQENERADDAPAVRMPTWNELEAITQRRLAELEAMSEEDREREWERERDATAYWRATQICNAIGIVVGHTGYDELAAPDDLAEVVPEGLRDAFVHIP